ncbi:MAG: hypothetical protein ACREBU_23180, partial [Nitrososphaera sp.]
PPYFSPPIGATPAHLGLGVVSEFKTALGILRAVRALALNTGDDLLTEYALRLQDAMIDWSKILPREQPEAPAAGLGYM